MGGHLASLTSLRFFAAMLVALYHAGVWVESATASPSGPFRFGHVGVTFFYVLSGFVLTWNWREGERARSFYLRRFARIYPLHLLTLSVAALLILVLVKGDLAVTTVLAHLLLVQAWVPDASVVFTLNSPSWSLSNEVSFYLVFPLLAATAARWRRGHWLLLGAGVAWLGVGGLALLVAAPQATWALYFFPLYRVGEFAVGVALALAMRSGFRLPLSATWGLVLAVVSYLAIWVGDRLLDGFLGREMWASQIVILPGLAIAVLTCAQRDAAGGRSRLHHPWFVKLGQWSFALYMVHGLVFMATEGWHRSGYLVALPLVLVSVILSGILYEWWERPIEARIRAWGHERESVVARAE